MEEKSYCPECNEWNFFGKLDEVALVQKQMEKEGEEGNASNLFENNQPKFAEFHKRYFEENRIIAAGCCVINTCVICGTELISKEKE